MLIALAARAKQTEPLQFPIEGRAVNTQDLGSLFDVPSGSSEGLNNRLALDFLQRQKWRHFIAGGGRIPGNAAVGKVVTGDLGAAAKQDGALDHALQLSNISGPLVPG